MSTAIRRALPQRRISEFAVPNGIAAQTPNARCIRRLPHEQQHVHSHSSPWIRTLKMHEKTRKSRSPPGILCERRDSNPYTQSGNKNLNLARLPISPLSQTQHPSDVVRPYTELQIHVQVFFSKKNDGAGLLSLRANTPSPRRYWLSAPIRGAIRMALPWPY